MVESMLNAVMRHFNSIIDRIKVYKRIQQISQQIIIIGLDQR